MFVKKSAFIYLASLAVVLSSLVGCGNKDNRVNASKYLNKEQIGECSIQNISKYSAIGVSDLSKQQANKKNKLLDLPNDEIDDDEDFSYSLVGLTTEGIIEELDLLTSGGENVKSSNLNITYYEECGDFVFFSALPFSIADYANMVANSKRSQGLSEDAVGWEVNYWVYNPIRRLNYPLLNSIRYYDSKTKSNKYVDTSYLIHKTSGKIFPCSSHRAYIDVKNIDNNYWFSVNTNEVVDKELETYEPTLGDVFFYGVSYGKDVGSYLNGDYFSHLVTFKRKNSHYFDNGFCSGMLNGTVFGNTIDFQCFGIGLREGLIVKFNQETFELEVSQFEGVSFIGSDIYGNLLAEKNGIRFIYKQSTGTFVQAGDLFLDCLTKRFVSFNDYQIIFYDSDLNVDKIMADEAFPNCNFASSVLFISDSELGGSCLWLNFSEKVFVWHNTIYKLEIDETDNNIAFSVTEIGRLPIEGDNFDYYRFFIYDSLFCFANNCLYKVDLSGNYNCTLIDFSGQYTIKDIYFNQETQCLSFHGVDNSTLADVEGYITEDGTVTFDVKEMQKTISVFTPIN